MWEKQPEPGSGPGVASWGQQGLGLVVSGQVGSPGHHLLWLQNKSHAMWSRLRQLYHSSCLSSFSRYQIKVPGREGATGHVALSGQERGAGSLQESPRIPAAPCLETSAPGPTATPLWGGQSPAQSHGKLSWSQEGLGPPGTTVQTAQSPLPSCLWGPLLITPQAAEGVARLVFPWRQLEDGLGWEVSRRLSWVTDAFAFLSSYKKMRIGQHRSSTG